MCAHCRALSRLKMAEGLAGASGAVDSASVGERWAVGGAVRPALPSSAVPPTIYRRHYGELVTVLCTPGMQDGLFFTEIARL